MLHICNIIFLADKQDSEVKKVELNDEETKVYIPLGIQSGEKIRIPGKGYKDGKGSRGDLVAEVKIMVPKKLTNQERKIFEQLNQISAFNPRKE